MSKKTAGRTREKWVDDVKVIACILVVLGHFFQSMTKARRGCGQKVGLRKKETTGCIRKNRKKPH